MLAHAREGSPVLFAKDLLDAPDEVRLFIQGAPRDDEGPIFRQGLLLYLLQTPRAEVDALRRQEGVGAASHDVMVLLCAACGTKRLFPLRFEGQIRRSRQAHSPRRSDSVHGPVELPEQLV